MEHKVSIITPTYNSANYIIDTIVSVQRQSYQNWEMLIVDDFSSDETCEIVVDMRKKDSRIRLMQKKENGGAAMARNMALENATGRFIAYLDADDLWYPEKLRMQVSFMLENGYGFTCTSYEVISDIGTTLNKYVHMLPKLDYMGYLCNNLLQTVGIMADITIVDKQCLVMPLILRRQDAATWLQVLKSDVCCYGLDIILAQYRRTKNSLSSNKFKAVRGIWALYRDIEKLSFPLSCYCFIRYAFLAVWKRMYNEGGK